MSALLQTLVFKSSPAVLRAISQQANPVAAVGEIADQLQADNLTGLIFFCGANFDLAVLGKALADCFACPMIGCTTAGEVYSPLGYVENSLVAVAFYSPWVQFSVVGIADLGAFVCEPDRNTLAMPHGMTGRNKLGFMLIDGLAQCEERVAALLVRQLRGLPLVGGSSGDGYAFESAPIFYQGVFRNNAAAVAIISTDLPLQTFQIQHFEPTDQKLVITEADVSTRTVHEINGQSASKAYADMIGVNVSALSAEVFAAHPLMLRLGDQYFVRSIQRANADGSLSFFCAIDIGLVLSLGRCGNLLAHLEDKLARLSDQVGPPLLLLACDCILRKAELKQARHFDKIRDLLANYPCIGFNTYGEQFGGLHVNQTLTAFAVGSRYE